MKFSVYQTTIFLCKLIKEGLNVTLSVSTALFLTSAVSTNLAMADYPEGYLADNICIYELAGGVNWTRGNEAYDYFMDSTYHAATVHGDFDTAMINARRAKAAAKTSHGRQQAQKLYNASLNCKILMNQR